MKFRYILFVLSICHIIGISCSQSDDSIEPSISPIDNLKAISGQNKITLQWNYTGDTNVSYVEINYSFDNKSETVKYEPKGEASSEYVIPVGEGDENKVYKFILTSYDTQGNKSAPKNIKGKAFSNDDQDSDINNILNSVTVESIINGGVKFVWINENELDHQLKVSYTQNDQVETVYFDLLSLTPEGIISTGILGETTFVLQIIDNDEEISSRERELIYIPSFRPDLPKSGWAIHSCSSQKSITADGAPKYLIDGTNATMWSASIANANQWIIVDLGKRAILDKFGLQRQAGNDSHHGWDMNFYIGDDPDDDIWQYTLEYESNSKTKSWPMNYEFNRTVEGTQWYSIPTTLKATGRYVKIECMRIASGAYFHMGEFYASGTYLD